MSTQIGGKQVRLLALLLLVVVVVGALFLTAVIVEPNIADSGITWVNKQLGTNIPVSHITHVVIALSMIGLGVLFLYFISRSQIVRGKEREKHMRFLLLGVVGLKESAVSSDVAVSEVASFDESVLDELERNIAAQGARVDVDAKTLLPRYADAEKRIVELRSRLGDISEQVVVLETRGSTIRSGLNELDGIRIGIEERLSDAVGSGDRRADKALEDLIKWLQETEEVVTTLEGLPEKIEEAQRTAEALLKRAKALGDEENGIAGALSALDELTTDIDNELDEFDDDDEDETPRGQLAKQLGWLKSFTETSDELEKLVPEISTAKQRAQELLARAKELTDNESGVEKSVRDLQDTASQIENSLDSIDGPEDLRSEFDEATEKIRELSDSLAKLEGLRKDIEAFSTRDDVKKEEPAAVVRT